MKKSESTIKDNLNNSILSIKSKIPHPINSLKNEENNIPTINAFNFQLENNTHVTTTDIAGNIQNHPTEEINKDPTGLNIINTVVDIINPDIEKTTEIFDVHFKPSKSILNCNEEYIKNKNLGENALNYYKLQGKEIINKKSDLKDYKECYRRYLQETMTRVNKKDTKRKKRIIFIHDSFILLRSKNHS